MALVLVELPGRTASSAPRSNGTGDPLVNSIGCPHTRARAVVDLAAADFFFGDYQIATGRTCCVVR